MVRGVGQTPRVDGEHEIAAGVCEPVEALGERVDLGVAEVGGRVGGGGGGPADFAQGGGPDVSKLDDALDDAPGVLRKVLDA